MKKESSAGIIVFKDVIVNGKDQRHYLILNYKNGHWDFPKGKLEPGETKIDAAIRELHEETDLEADIYSGFEQSLTYVFRDRRGRLVDKDVTYFVGVALNDKVILSEEHLYYKWLSFDESIKILTYENAQQILKAADRFLEAHE